MVQLVRTKGATGEYGPLHEMQMTEIVAWFKANSDKEGNVADGIVLYGDALLKAAPKEAQEEELFEWVMSDYTLDRDMERIDPTGWDLKNYKKNPVVLWGHNPNIPAIGVALDAGVDKERGLLTGRIKFSSKEVDPFAWMIKEKIREGILKTGSVGFRPVKVEIVDQSDDGKGTKPSEQARLIHRKQELYEFSIVNIPANPNAVLRRDVNGDTIDTPPAHDGAWSVRGKGYKQQDGWVDPEHAVMQKEIKDIIEVLAEMRKETEPEEVVLEEPVTKAADGVLADMALRLDDIEDLIKGLIDRVGVAEPESTKPEFYEELFKGSRSTPSALDKLLMPAKYTKE
jgi:HK97 family phage prohead protease